MKVINKEMNEITQAWHRAKNKPQETPAFKGQVGEGNGKGVAQEMTVKADKCGISEVKEIGFRKGIMVSRVHYIKGEREREREREQS